MFKRSRRLLLIIVLLITSIYFTDSLIKELNANNLMDLNFSKSTKKENNIENFIDIVTIKDKKLMAALNQEINKRDNTTRPDNQYITVEDMESFTGVLNLSNKGITNITGLEYATNISTLNLDKNEIEDLTKINTLTNLTNLSLSSNRIKDLTPISELTNLIYLNVSTNWMNLIPLSKLKNLEYLDISNNKIYDLTPISGLTNLKYLNLSDTYVSSTSIEYIRDLKNLIYLNLSNSNINSLEPISGLINLKYLDLSNNPINDLTLISKFINLKYLNLSNNKINTLEFIRGLTNLTTLSLNSNLINDLTPISGLTNLTTLNIYSNQISDLSPIKGLTNLTNLDIHNNIINDLSPISELKKLINLNLYKNQINDLTPISGLINLKELNISNNQINDLSPISGLINLTKLIAFKNQISDLSPISGLINLTNLDLYGNEVSDLRPLKNLSVDLNVLDQEITKDFKGINQALAPEFKAYDIDGTEIPVDLGTPSVGVIKDYSGIWGIKEFSGVVTLKNYKYDNKPILTADDIKSTKLNQVQSDEELKKLFNVSAIDSVDGDLTDKVTVDQSNVNYDVIGTYDVKFNVINTVGNKANEKVSKLNIIDGEVPIITSKDNVDIRAKKPKTDEELKSLFKVSANDNVDGDITDKVVVNQNKVDYDVPGDYDVIFSVKDSSGNRYDKKGFLKISSNEPPTLKGVEDIEIIEGSDFNPMEGVSANDYEDGDITSAIDVYSKGLKDSLSTIYNYSITDSDGNVVEVNRTVKYVSVPNNKPIIDGVDNTNIFVGEYFDSMDKVSAIDKEDGDITSTIFISGKVNNNIIGDYTLTYSVVDSDNNTVSVDRTVSVKDIVSNNKPIIDGVNDVKVKVGSEFDIMSSVSAIDKEDGDITSLIRVNGFVDTDVVGDYKLEYLVIDSDNNIVSVDRTVSVYLDEPIIDNNKVDSNNKIIIGKKLIETGKKSIYFIFVSVLSFIAYFFQIKKHNLLKGIYIKK